jgi:hypothetical protein
MAGAIANGSSYRHCAAIGIEYCSSVGIEYRGSVGRIAQSRRP